MAIVQVAVWNGDELAFAIGGAATFGKPCTTPRTEHVFFATKHSFYFGLCRFVIANRYVASKTLFRAYATEPVVDAGGCVGCTRQDAPELAVLYFLSSRGIGVDSFQPAFQQGIYDASLVVHRFSFLHKSIIFSFCIHIA
ncbi:hypothetical protein HMPREF1988_02064 [Porphyromonas gingivalis F0185]|nr:hypothetical protein HMPREF1988_02064 [Porphyromonas gingivalis F0185]